MVYQSGKGPCDIRLNMIHVKRKNCMDQRQRREDRDSWKWKRERCVVVRERERETRRGERIKKGESEQRE